MSDLRLGVLGYGLRSALARTAHQPGGGSVVTVVADPDPRARALAGEAIPGVRTLASLPDLLEQSDQLDAVLLLTPDHLHAEHACRTLEHGLATFVEKPMATTIADADLMLRTAQRTGTRLYVGHNMRHMPVIVTLRELVLAGTIGDVKAIWCRHFVSPGGDFYFKDWHADRRNTTGLLLQKGAHDIDVMHWLAGGFTRRASAMGTLAVYGGISERRDNSDRRMTDWYSTDNWPPTAQRDLAPVLDVEDLSMANLTLDNGVLCSYQQCHFAPDYWRNYTVIGTAGRLENLGDGPGSAVHVHTSRTDRYSAPDRVVTVPDGDNSGHGGADSALIAEFVRFAREGGATDTSPVAARESVAAAVAATMSLRDGGRPQQVPPVDASLAAYFAGGQSS
ncbi:Gfo/Idh/MocA family protein [Dermacoccaceae bacterium W4C1]